MILKAGTHIIFLEFSDFPETHQALGTICLGDDSPAPYFLFG
jgi:hypothetical protein